MTGPRRRAGGAAVPWDSGRTLLRRSHRGYGETRNEGADTGTSRPCSPRPDPLRRSGGHRRAGRGTVREEITDGPHKGRRDVF
ncbi:hypothetical protein SNE510_17740 [Streptomyces sp. NE5-10]|nr:hypothetical protein GCM10018784_32990 [Streptomyces hydrogenans]GHJ92255.1 hypothetical protein SNE510_17740 [Streptomyces sp. NE5-10]